VYAHLSHNKLTELKFVFDLAYSHYWEEKNKHEYVDAVSDNE